MSMIVRITLEMALGKEFDYEVPEALVDRVALGSRVKVPFGSREVMGVVTGLPPVPLFQNSRQSSMWSEPAVW